MNLSNEFSINAHQDVVWSTMLDIERVAGCVPGAEVVGVSDDGGYAANVKIKVGPMAMMYRGALRVAEQDDAGHRAVLLANARETRGQGAAKARMVMQLLNGGPTTVRVDTDLQVTGRVAQMGRGVMQDVANRLMQDFAANLQQMIASEGGEPSTREPVEPVPEAVAEQPAPTAPPAARDAEFSAGRLVLTVLRGRLAALLRALARLARRDAR